MDEQNSKHKLPKLRNFRQRAVGIFLIGILAGIFIYFVVSLDPSGSGWRSNLHLGMLNIMQPAGWGILFFMMVIGSGLYQEIFMFHFQDLPEDKDILEDSEE